MKGQKIISKATMVRVRFNTIKDTEISHLLGMLITLPADAHNDTIQIHINCLLELSGG